MRLEVTDLSKRFGARVALDGVGFRVEAGEIACLLGPSGCGKTTALRCIAGFETPDAGRIAAGEVALFGPGVCLPPERRHVGMVFQDYALFPHLDAIGNVAFGLHGLSRADRAARAREMLALVGLADHAGHYPHELSGGQQQRVALARALAPRPRLVLFDEPFSSLDAEARAHLAHEVRGVLKAAGATALLVTHDQQEAFAMADVVGVLRDGRLEQWDSAWRLYHAPASRFVAGFIGDGRLLPGQVAAPGVVQTELGAIHGGADAPPLTTVDVDVLLRPEDVVHDDASPLTAEVVDRAFRGAQFLYRLRLASGAEVLSLVSSHHDHPIGSRIGLRLESDHLVAFPR